MKAETRMLSGSAAEFQHLGETPAPGVLGTPGVEE